MTGSGRCQSIHMSAGICERPLGHEGVHRAGFFSWIVGTPTEEEERLRARVAELEQSLDAVRAGSTERVEQLREARRVLADVWSALGWDAVVSLLPPELVNRVAAVLEGR